MEWEIPLFKTYWEADDVEAVTKVLKRGTFWACGPEIELFEKDFADYVGVKYALSFNSGTSALHTLLMAHNVEDNEVIVPSFTFIATVNAVLLADAKPVFAESEQETFGLDAEDVKASINNDTKAIIALHYGGFPSRDIERLRKLADEHNLLLIEDAAESLGATINDKKVGTFGHSAIFSLCQNKIISSGEGGMLVTNSEHIYQKARLLRSHGRTQRDENHFSSSEESDYIQAGYNYRMPTMLASLANSQLNKIDKIIRLRRKNAEYYNKHLSRFGITITESENHFSVYQMYTIKLPNKEIRDRLQKHLEGKGIMSKVYFNPIHLMDLYKGGERFPKTESLSNRVLTIPMYPDMLRRELDYVIREIESFMGDKQ